MTVTAPLVFIDTETTGVHPDRQVWEIAMIRREPGQPDDELSFYVDVQLSDADPFGLNVGRFYERHPVGRWISKGGYPWTFALNDSHLKGRDAAARLVAQMTHGAHLVGAVPNFDAETLAPLLRAHGLVPSWHYHLVDVEALVAGKLGHPPPWSSDDLSRQVGVDPLPDDQRHTALGDARWARDVYDAVMGGRP